MQSNPTLEQFSCPKVLTFSKFKLLIARTLLNWLYAEVVVMRKILNASDDEVPTNSIIYDHERVS